MSATLRLRFGEPRHGWLPVRLVLGERRFDFRASYIYPTVSELLDLAGFALRRGDGQQSAGFWMEPGGYLLVAERAGDTVHVTVRTTDDLHRASEPDVVVADEVMEAVELAASIWRGLRSWKVRDSRDAWCGQFADPGIATLQHELRARRIASRGAG